MSKHKGSLKHDEGANGRLLGTGTPGASPPGSSGAGIPVTRNGVVTELSQSTTALFPDRWQGLAADPNWDLIVGERKAESDNNNIYSRHFTVVTRDSKANSWDDAQIKRRAEGEATSRGGRSNLVPFQLRYIRRATSPVPGGPHPIHPRLMVSPIPSRSPYWLVTARQPSDLSKGWQTDKSHVTHSTHGVSQIPRIWMWSVIQRYLSSS